MYVAKIARFYNPAIDYIIILLPVLVQLPVLPVLQELRVLPVLRVLVQLQEPQELPVLLLSWLLPSVPACSLLPRLIKKPIKAR